MYGTQLETNPRNKGVKDGGELFPQLRVWLTWLLPRLISFLSNLPYLS